jgi:hypothetical protein
MRTAFQVDRLEGSTGTGELMQGHTLTGQLLLD